MLTSNYMAQLAEENTEQQSPIHIRCQEKHHRWKISKYFQWISLPANGFLNEMQQIHSEAYTHKQMHAIC